MNKKDKIIYNILIYLENKDNSNMPKIREDLKAMAKHHRVILKSKKVRISIYDALKSFIINNEGYNITMNRLYNCIRLK